MYLLKVLKLLRAELGLNPRPPASQAEIVFPPADTSHGGSLRQKEGAEKNLCVEGSRVRSHAMWAPGPGCNEQVHIRYLAQPHSKCRMVVGNEEARLDLICPLHLIHLQIP